MTTMYNAILEIPGLCEIYYYALHPFHTDENRQHPFPIIADGEAGTRISNLCKGIKWKSFKSLEKALLYLEEWEHDNA